MNDILVAKMKEYWESLENGQVTNEDLFFKDIANSVTTSKDKKIIRDFLIMKFNEGYAVRIPDRRKTPTIHFEKVDSVIHQREYIRKVINNFPNGSVITSRMILKELPKKFQNFGEIVNVIQIAKRKKEAVLMMNSMGYAMYDKDTKCKLYKKVSDFTVKIKEANRPRVKSKKTAAKVNKKATKPITASQKDILENISKETVETLMYDKTPADTGIAIFHATLKLLADNENLKSQLKAIEKEKEDLEKALSQMTATTSKYRTEHLTFKELIKHAKRIDI